MVRSACGETLVMKRVPTATPTSAPGISSAASFVSQRRQCAPTAKMSAVIWITSTTASASPTGSTSAINGVASEAKATPSPPLPMPIISAAMAKIT